MRTDSSGSRRGRRRPVTTLLVLAAASTLILTAAVGPVVAKRPDGAKLKVRPFVCKGEVTAVSTTPGSITVKVVKGRKAVVGTQITFTLAAKAVIMRVGSGGVDVIGLGDVKVDDRVLVHARVDRSNPAAPVHVAWLILDRGPAPLK